MLSLIEKIRHGYLWDFHGGIHPPENKQQSVQLPVTEATLPKELVLPLKQHIGNPGELTVKVGDRVLKGQPLTKYSTTFMLPIHAPTSGTVTAIEPRLTAHPSGLSELSVVIQPDGEDKWIEKQTYTEFREKTPEELIEVIRLAGISGMGGAGFPTAKKIHSGLGKTDIFIVNAAECEPYITADDMLIRERAAEIVKGIEILEHILKPKLIIIGIEDNKPEAVKALEEAAINHDLVIRVIPTKYPSGGEKQLIKILTNQEVPNGGIPADINVLVQNVSSIYAIKRAVINGEPLIERIVTLTGEAFSLPRNVWVKLGTPVQALLDEFGYQQDKKHPRLIMGGPMMGFTLPGPQVPITKTASCILAPSTREIAPKSPEMACIRCGQCADACPISLLPQQLQWHARDKDYDKCEELNLFDCMECGVCAYVCPSEIPLVHYYRQAKAEIRTRKEEAKAAERAKQRFEEKKARLEREKAERENRSKQAAADRRKEMQQSDNGDAIAAAIERVKAQKAAEAGPKPAVAAAIARAKAKQAEAAQANSDTPDNSEMAKLREERKRQARERKAEKEKLATESSTVADNKPTENKEDKKASVAAAIARAKAKKAKQTEQTTEASESEPAEEKTVTKEPVDPKKAAVAAAIARAKAKKAKQAEQTTETSEPEPAEEKAVTKESVDPKKAAVAAAIARAKAKKAKQAEQTTETSEPEPPEETAITKEPIDPKKAAVAAAIARAKAKKAKQAEQATETSEPEPTEEKAVTKEPVDPKKAAVAAAIARAKAKKAKQAEENTKAKEKE